MASLDGSVRRRSQECQITAVETERVASYRTCTGFRADPLTEVLRNGARALLAQAVEAEMAEFVAKHADLKTATGLRRVVRHGFLAAGITETLSSKSSSLAFFPNTKGVLFQGPNPVDRRGVEEGLTQIFDFLKSRRVKRWTG